jgi:hypothetical protein
LFTHLLAVFDNIANPYLEKLYISLLSSTQYSQLKVKLLVQVFIFVGKDSFWIVHFVLLFTIHIKVHF